jgi:hypothetical protein
VDGWLKPFDDGFTFGGNVGVQPDTPNRIFILQRGRRASPTRPDTWAMPDRSA